MNAYFGSSRAILAESAELNSDISIFLLEIKAYLERIRHLGSNVTDTLHKYNLGQAHVPYYQVVFSTKNKSMNSLKLKMKKPVGRSSCLFNRTRLTNKERPFCTTLRLVPSPGEKSLLFRLEIEPLPPICKVRWPFIWRIEGVYTN